MNIVVLNNEEEFIQFLDPELCSLTETIEKGGLRTVNGKELLYKITLV